MRDRIQSNSGSVPQSNITTERKRTSSDDEEENSKRKRLRTGIQQTTQRWRDALANAMTKSIKATWELRSYKEAIERSDVNQWRNAMDEELQAMKRNKVYTIENLPINATVLPCK